MSSKQNKKVKGYALLTDTGAFYEAITAARQDAHHYWEHEFEDLGFSIVPCTITYDLPITNRKRKSV